MGGSRWKWLKVRSRIRRKLRRIRRIIPRPLRMQFRKMRKPPNLPVKTPRAVREKVKARKVRERRGMLLPKVPGEMRKKLNLKARRVRRVKERRGKGKVERMLKKRRIPVKLRRKVKSCTTQL